MAAKSVDRQRQAAVRWPTKWVITKHDLWSELLVIVKDLLSQQV